MCESVFKTAGEQQGNGMGTAWERHGMCESALRLCHHLLLSFDPFVIIPGEPNSQQLHRYHWLSALILKLSAADGQHKRH
jgi:hypothetical protein